MKRSEMVDIFDGSYDVWAHDIEIWKSFDSYGDYLVHLAIEAGMSPPIDYIDDTGYSNGWEPEDD